jgi:diguanylate cyclase (GGDEF)-like protein
LPTAAFSGAIIWLGLCQLPAFAAASNHRVTLSVIIVATYTFCIAFELNRERRKSLYSRTAAILVPFLHAAIFLLPLGMQAFLPTIYAASWLTVFTLETMLYAVGTAFIVLVLTKERTLRMHKTAALTDPLTGLFNRRGLIEAARELAEKYAKKAGKPVAMLAFDLDNFKSINDRFGHALGDDVIKLFASTANSSLRLTDFVVRLGGEEFAAIMPGTLEDGLMVAERVRAAFEAAARTVSGCYVGATVSVGVASHETAANIDALLARADAALYAAKANGRNRVETELPQFDLLQTDAEQTNEPHDVDANDVAVDWNSYRQAQWGSDDRQAAA